MSVFASPVSKGLARPALRRSGSVLQRKCTCEGGADQCEACRRKSEHLLQRSAADRVSPCAVPPIVHHALQSASTLLDPPTRLFFEDRLGHDFSRVRIHDSTIAADSAKAVHALAYTVGDQIVFGENRFRPHTTDGRRLLAHELTHVTQQTTGARQTVEPPTLQLAADGRYEDEALAAESHAGTVGLIGAPGYLQRKPDAGTTPALCGGIWTCAASPCDQPDPGKAGSGGKPTSWTLKVLIDVEAPSAAEVTVETIGHTYVEFSDSTGAIYTYGFYPNKAVGTPDPVFRPEVGGCTVHPDVNHASCVDYEEVFHLSEPNYTKALKLAQAECRAPSRYNIQTFNCTTFADVVANAAGRSLPPSRGKVGSGMLSTIADNPYTLINALRRRDVGPTYGLSGDSDIRIAIASASKTELAAIPVIEKIRVINRLVDGWVSDDDISAIETLCAAIATTSEMSQINRAVHRREGDLYNEDQKKHFHNAVNRPSAASAP